MRGDEIVALGAVAAIVGGVVAMWSVYYTKRASAQADRLEVIKKALDHPSIDDHSKSEMLRLLAEEHRQAQRPFFDQFGGVINVARVILMAAGWITFIFSGSILALYSMGLWEWMPMEPIMIFCVLGFIAMTLPTALRELMHRGRPVEAKQ